MLKDFARNQDDQGNCIAIVHAHVYLGTNGPLTGWVSVQGKEDFIKALRKFLFSNRIMLTKLQVIWNVGSLGIVR